MNKEELREFIKEIKDLPTLPTLYISLRDKLYDPRSSASDIAHILASDQSICSNILKIANSAFYGLSGRITTIPHAIVVIGFNGIHHIVLNMTMTQMVTGQTAIEGFDMISFWEHSLAVGTIAKIIGKRCKGVSQEEIFTAGLLHDIGKIVIYKHMPEKFAEIMNIVRTRDLLIREAEEQVLSLDHTQIGTALLEYWRFPDFLARTTAYHHNPVVAKEKTKAAAIVHLADILARALEIGSGGDDKIPPLVAEAWQELSLTEYDLDQIIDEVDPEMENSRVFSELIK